MSPTISTSKKGAKSSGRQTNNSLSSISGQIHIDNSSAAKSNDSKSQANNNASSGKTTSTSSSNESKKSTKVPNSNDNKNNAKTEKKSGARNSTVSAATNKASSSSVLTETEEVLQIGMHKVLEHVKNHKDAWPFMDPVEEDIAPRYYSIIRRPMDLQQMDERLESGQYMTFTDFRNDFKLIVNNCRLYNGQNNEYTEMVNNLQHAFEKATKKYFDQNSSDEDGDLEYPDLKTNVFREKNNSTKNTITPKIKEIIGTKGLPIKSKKSSVNHKSEKSDEKPAATEKPIEKTTEKRGRKRKQKFKDKRRADKAGNNSEHSDDEDADVVAEDDEDDDNLLDEEEVVPAKKAKKEKLEKVEKAEKFKKADKVKESKKVRKSVDKKSLTKVDTSPTVAARRKSARKEVEPPSQPPPDDDDVDEDDEVYDESDVELEAVSKKKKGKHTVESTASPEKGKSKIAKRDLKKLKSNKKRKSSEVATTATRTTTTTTTSAKAATSKIMDVSGDEEEKLMEESPKRGKNSAKEKKAEKKTNKKIALKSKQNDKKAMAGKGKNNNNSKKKAKMVKGKATKAREESRSRSSSVSSNASSMSDSPMRFTVDLHEKYSKSASNTSINKIDSVDSSRINSNRARSPSPSLSLHSSENSNGVKDKFDMIKQRRNRTANSDDKWKQIVKNAEKIKDKTSTSSTDGPKVQEKNQKLKETIEKLKQQNKQSKKLLNKLSDAKTTSSDSKTEAKSSFDLLKESKPPKTKVKSKETSGVEQELDIPAETSSKKSPNKKVKEKPGKKKGKHASKTPNMEALELETEQTLKDINRWLEHTPRFPEFNSASNSPTRFNSLLYDFDTVTSKLDPADFRRPLPITANDSTSSATTFTSATDQQKTNATTKSVTTPTKLPSATTAPSSTANDDTASTAKENKPAPKQTIQLTGIPPPPGPHKRDKEPKRKTLKEKISAMIPKRKDIHRTIERMQPGKTKGNLIGTIHSVSKPEDVSILGTSNSNKLKDTKNALVQETDDTGPKLSLGTVLNTAGFGLIQQHNFADNENTKDDDLLCDSVSKDACSDDMELEEIVTSTEQMAREKERKEKEEKEKAEKTQSPGDKSATPNLNAWLKAFGVPKKQKKSEEEDSKKLDKSSKESPQNSNSHSANSPSVSNDPISLPTPRTRKASTGSTISERSSYSQDPDSPRIGIDERLCGAYPAPYPSPLGASPIMTSPKDDTQTKPASPYASMNGSMRVGFYQDTTTKSSPEKSCSPREQPSASPYSNYAQHLYVSTTTSGSSNSYGNMSYTSPVKVNQNAPLGFNNKKQPSYFDQYKQPKSQDSDYNSSVGSNPTSPYQSQHSPYQSENSPYQQSQTSPYAQQPNSIQSNVSSPYQNQQSPYQDTSMQQQHSPYNQNNAGQDVHAPQHITSMPKTSPQPVPQHINPSMNTVSPPTHQQQQQQQQQQQVHQPLETKTTPNSMQQYGLQAYSSHYPNLVDPPAPSVINSSSSLHDKPKPDDEQRDILNLDYAKQTAAASKSSLSSKPADLSHIEPINKTQQHGYEHSMFEPMGFNKNYDISSTKAIEMFNRAATMSFSKSFPTPLSAVGTKSDNPSGGLLNTYQPPSMHSNYSLYSLDNKSATHIGYNPHENDSPANQPQSMVVHQDKHMPDPSHGRHGLYGTVDRIDPMSSMATATIPNDNRMKPSELNVPTIPHRYDVPTYDPNMRIHSLVDDNLNGSNCYYPSKDPTTAQSLYGKSVLPPSQTSPSSLNPYKLPSTTVQPPPPPQPQPQSVETKPKRTRKKKNTVEPAPVSVQQPIPPPQAPVINNHQMMQQHNLGWNTIDPSNSHPNASNQIPPQQSQTHPSLLNQQHPQHPLQAPPTQGFQSYAGLKPPGQTGLVKNTPPPEATPISLKTNSIVPGSAFNFGPTSSGSLALGGIYGENTPYLDEYRASANPYYLPPQTHRTTAQPEQNTDNSGVPSAAGSAGYVAATRGATSPAPTYHQFLPHHPYTNSQIYQQYLRTEEYRQRMMFANQGLLPHSAPTGYPQPSYHPALGMHKPYGW